MRKLLSITLLVVLMGFSAPASAALQNNGNDLIYDTDRDITWYNPNLPAVTWDQAIAWAESLTVDGVTGWRLPTAYNQDGSYPLYEYNVIGSELGHLYYVELGNVAYGPLTNTGPFANLAPGTYWSSTTTAQFTGNAFIFNFNTGRQAHADKALPFYVMAVHAGNIGTPVSMAEATIDIRPWSKDNPINYKARGILPVAILSTEDFDAPSQIDVEFPLTFGRTGDEPSLSFCSGSEDANGDGIQDLICHFYTQDAGFQCGDTTGILKGQTIQGIRIEGSDPVKIVPCK